MVVGPGQSRFAVVRFKSIIAKDRFKKQGRLEKGVYLHYTSQSRSALLLFHLDPIPKDTPDQASLILSVSGLPFHLHYRRIETEIFGGLWTQKSNDRFMITRIRELEDRPLLAFTGARIFEVTFRYEAIPTWFAHLTSIYSSLPMSGWDNRGRQCKKIFNTCWRYVPSCINCGSVCPAGSHRTECPYLTLRDSMWRSFDISKPGGFTGPDSTQGSVPSTVLDSHAHLAKMGNFTRQD